MSIPEQEDSELQRRAKTVASVKTAIQNEQIKENIPSPNPPDENISVSEENPEHSSPDSNNNEEKQRNDLSNISK